MRRHLTLAAAALAAPLIVAGPAAAHDAAAGHGYTVQANEVTRGPLPYATQNAFLPAFVKVHVGDTVTWTTTHGHTVTFLGRTKPEQLPFVMPDPGGATYEGFTDAAGQPFHFNGLAKWIFNPRVFSPIGSNVVRGPKALHNRPFFGEGPKKPGKTSFRFTKPGLYRYVCLIHPGMDGAVRVVPKTAKVPSADAVRAQARKLEQRNWALAKKLDKVKPPANTILAGVGNTTTLIAFKPAVLTVKAGTTVRIVNGSSTEFHNVVLGPVEYLKTFFRETALFPEGPGSPNQVSPPDVHGSDPGQPQIHTGTNHGNGFFVTPVLDRVDYQPLPSSSEVTFTTPGTYTYYCGVHFPDMKGTIVVTP